MAGRLALLRRADASSAIESILRRVLAQIEPTTSQKSGAGRSHNHLRRLLDSGHMSRKIVRSYLSGSYARDTAIRPLDDVDVIFEIDPAGWSTPILSSRPPPERVLETFATAIRRRYELSSVFGQRRSVRLELNHLDVDVVPAIPLSSDSGVIFVPDRNTGSWIKSSPLKHSSNATQVNSRRSGKFKPLVKLAKFWNSNLPDSARCKSFMVETIAIRIFSVTPYDTLSEGLVLFWDFLAAQFGQRPLIRWPDTFGMSFGWPLISVPDAAETGSNTAAHVDRARARALALKARTSRDKLLAGYDARFDKTLERHVLAALRA